MDQDLKIQLAPRQQGCAVPLTDVQQLMWGSGAFHTRASRFRMCALSARALGSFDIQRMQAAVSAVVARHEALRTRFALADNGARQIVDPPAACPLQIVDISNSARGDVQRQAQQIARTFVTASRYLSMGPLFEVQIIKLSDDDHLVIVAVDHMVADAISCSIVAHELWALYDASPAMSRLPALTMQFPDYAVWQQRTATHWLKIHGPYWRARLAGAPRMFFPRDADLLESAEPTVATTFLPFGKKPSDELRAAAAREQVSLPTAMLSIYAITLARWCRQTDFVLALTSHGRRGRLELQNMVGFLAHAPRARIEILSDDTFSSALQRIQLEFASAHAHQDCGLLPTFVPEFATDAAFNWISSWSSRAQPQLASSSNPLRILPYTIPASDQGAEFCEFSPIFSDSAAGIVVTVRYRPDRLHTATVERFGRNLRWYAQAFVLRAHARLDRDYVP